MIEITLPNSCEKCKFLGAYVDGVWERRLYYRCELASLLFGGNYNVRLSILEDFCPLKMGIIGVDSVKE